MLYRRLLIPYLAPQWPRVVGLLVLILAGIGMDLAIPLILRTFIDTVLGIGPMDQLLWIGGGFLVLAFAKQIAAISERYMAENVGLTATNKLRADLTLHCLRLDRSFHTARTPGELIERIDGDIGTLSNFFARLVVELLGGLLLLCGILALLFAIDWRIGLVQLMFAVLALAIMNGLRPLAVPAFTQTRQASAELFGFLEERLAGTEDVRANGATGYVMRLLAGHARAMLAAFRRMSIISGLTSTPVLILFAAGTAIALGIGVWLLFQGATTIGTLYLIFSYSELLERPINQIARQLDDLQQATASILRIDELLQRQPAIRDGQGAVLPDAAPDVAFEQVVFAYQDERNTPEAAVLQDVSFRLQPGEVLGLLGRTGSGKTTITRLLLRHVDASAGAVRLHGIDLRELRLADLRRHVGMVTQEVQLFNASIRDNLTFFDHDLPDERITTVLEELGLGEWLRSQPDGLATVLPPGGGVSAGEAQLIAFARIFLHNPKLVILDEASSRLDPATERLMERAVARLPAGRTAIIIAHRLETVQRADSILILDQGRVAEHGTRTALLANPDSRFAQLLRVGMEEALA